MRYLVLSLIFLLIFTSAHAQQAAAVDSMKRELAKAKTTEDKIYWLDFLSRTLMNVDLKQADDYGQQLIDVAEESRDRKLMIRAYTSNGVRCSYQPGNTEYVKRSIGFYDKALAIARQNKMDDKTAGILLRLSHIYLAVPDNDKALNLANQGFSLVSTLNNDSLKAEAYNLYGDVYISRNEKIIALRNYFTAARIAEQLKIPVLERSSMINLSVFYSSVGDFDQAIDYYMKANKKLSSMKEKNTPYVNAMDQNYIGNLYAQKGNHDMAIKYFRKSVQIADSLKFTTLKVPGYSSLLNEYLRMNEPQKALEYFNSAEGIELKQYLANFGFSGEVDKGYGYIYHQLRQYDSAKIYFERAAPYYEKTASDFSKATFFSQFADYYSQINQLDKAIELFRKARESADKVGQLEVSKKAVQSLDSLYRRKGDYQQASVYNSIYHQYKDSLETVNKEKEISQVEIAEEQQREAQLEKERLELKRKRYNIQYLAITIGIATLLIVLVMMGMFKVSAATIKMIGFFTFLMFFEFIFLIFKKNIAYITEGEPWKDLMFMIALAALLLPLHHWVEHKVIHYLTSHNRLTSSGKTLMDKFKRRRTEV
ncbi:tetratricopeptide repeat protein [Terrimonas sp. NA20]|uniref:Tetratricopeptide repeat protein n=1 Tax=Terrimonas ginsenosidimutans TaxID=2908004 RepID=A0ABS9KZ39_9BACT|nr:tetratricopeptide repeat protein [Terrimonas ginsenosidimutans]MCG2617654.1 tetratricopeptide repeat protein [Terrimonas ginsenosidimutans]